MHHLKQTAFAALAALAVTPALAAWQEDVNRFDQDRLSRIDESRERGLRAAEQGGSRADLTAIHRVLDPEGRPITARDLMGTWRCRQMKLGGLAPEIVYDWFRCRVRETPSGLFFEKVTGTERISGYLEAYENGRYLLLGELTVKNEREKPYSGGNKGVGAITTSADAVGVISSTARGRARIEFPFPNIESDFDLIELRRD
jgi:Domain of unknown function (DUF4893)